MNQEPKTLLEATAYFADPEKCRDYIASRRWPDGVKCPVCGSEQVTYLKSVRRYQCSKRHAKRQFTAKTGTIFEDSPLSLEKWLIAMWLIVNAKNGMSSYEIGRALGVTQKTGWFMLQRIRLAMRNGSIEKLSGNVEADETGIGGLAKNMHKHVREERDMKQGFASKTIVAGMMERDGKIILKVIPSTQSHTLHPLVKYHVQKGSNLYTDAHLGYTGLSAWYTHQIVDHAYAYVDGQIHTNSLENFWSLLKRTMRGTYVSVEPFHLHRYLDEYTFRFNNRKTNDAARFDMAVSQIVGRRLTYSSLTGKESVVRYIRG